MSHAHSLTLQRPLLPLQENYNQTQQPRREGTRIKVPFKSNTYKHLEEVLEMKVCLGESKGTFVDSCFKYIPAIV